MKAMNVYYDFDEGQYFKIDKITGNIVKSNKNGQNPIKFKAQYTGSDYKLRKQVQRDLSPPSLTNSPFRVQYQHKHTIPIEKNQVKQISNKSTGEMKPLKTLRLSQSKKSDSQIWSFSGKLAQYTKLKENMCLQNHTLRSNIPGTLPNLDIGKQQKANNLRGLMSERHRKITKNKSLAHLRNSEVDLPDCLVTKNQIRREKQLFLKYNKNFVMPSNQRNLKELTERKKNLKILEKLHLDKNDRITSQVFTLQHLLELPDQQCPSTE